MDPHSSRWIGAIVCSVLLAGPGLAAPPSAEDPRALAAEATTLYTDGRYADARPLLEKLDGLGQATGPLLYRLAFCQRSAGESSAGAATEQRALATLEQELPKARDVEVPFYLVNAYQNVGRAGDAQRVATEATARFAKGELPRPTEAEELFQLGKLHADAGNDTATAEWYGRALEAYVAAGQAQGPYVRRASRFLAERAFRASDFTSAQKYFSILTAAGEGDANDFDRLAVSSARAGLFREAAAAWKQAQLLGPQNADRASYGARIAQMAAELAPLPERAPSGKTWPELGQADLETLMREQGEAARQILAEASAVEGLSREGTKPFRQRLLPHQALLVAGALEYSLRGLSIREAAFVGGYSPLLLDPHGWRIRRTPVASDPPEQGSEPTDAP